MTNDEYEQLQKEALALIAEADETSRVCQIAFDELNHLLEIFDPAPDAPLTLFQAVCLPELGGVLYRHIKSEPSTTVTVKTLRLAIERGQLAITRINTKNLYVTRRQIQQWTTSCQDIRKSHISSNVQPATTKLASSPTQRPRSSTMERSGRARDAALMILSKLK